MDWYVIFIVVGLLVGAVVVTLKRRTAPSSSSPLRLPERDLPWQWRDILKEHVDFYNRLSHEEKKQFEYKLHVFLLNVRVIGIRTQATDKDRVLVAASAVIPLFRFSHWHYSHLSEVHVYPDKFPIPETNKMANGLVGWGAMEGKMFLSRKALYNGFANTEDGKNVAIHEFIHLLDKKDGEVDGIPEDLMREADISPWLSMIEQKMREIKEGKSSIRKYGAVNREEFLAVVTEYFFEKPDKMREEEPDLYMALDSIFNPAKDIRTKRKSRSKYTNGKSVCPCGSGKSYSECCGKYNIVY